MQRGISELERSNPVNILSNVETWDKFQNNDSMRPQEASNIKTDFTSGTSNGIASGIGKLPGSDGI